ncbi:patatin [Acidipropionibacterium jensenii]|uniref:Patatin n=1 Tax=Acidipropionibacterium jensenii TaxID=1749 RepID=A0A3T0RXE4_9ACTN|nr:patatin-like phospholipase family protein [Acidipropionibacterium jensenii]AZZ38827.1 patatin [Acidipropionibacterium jensenii]
MELPSWLGLPVLTFGHATMRPRHGLVLAGGGARASFQVGALRHLYDVVGIHPEVITATSAGSVVACTIAQWSDPEDQSRALADLDRMWMAMQDQSEMFAPRAWFKLLLEKGPEWTKLIDHDRSHRPHGLAIPRISLPFTHSQDGASTVVDPAEPVAGGEESRISTSLTGQAATLDLATREIPVPDGATWRPSVVLQVLSALSKLTRDGGDIQAILRGADASGSTYRAGPILSRLLDPAWFDSERLASSGVRLRVAMVALESGELRFMTERGTLVDRDNHPLPGTRHDVTRGVLASCSVPGVFRPVEIDGEHYVDGGVRENIPAEMAIGHLGVTHPYVITCGPLGLSRSEDFGSKNMLDLATRSIDILTDEAGRDEVAYALNAGAEVIAPEIDVHSSMTVDPGLLRINRDYGWMSSALVHSATGASMHDLVNEIVRLRMRGWELEKEWLAGRTAPGKDSTAEAESGPQRSGSEDVIAELAEVKGRLADAADRLPRLLRPEGADTWGRQLEAHGHAPEGLTPPW